MLNCFDKNNDVSLTFDERCYLILLNGHYVRYRGKISKRESHVRERSDKHRITHGQSFPKNI